MEESSCGDMKCLKLSKKMLWFVVNRDTTLIRGTEEDTDNNRVNVSDCF